jgi:hypothetical protein
MTKTKSEHIKAGTLQPARHDPRAVVHSPGTPIPTKKLTPIQAKLWDAVVGVMPSDQIGTVDAYLLTELVETFTLTQKARALFARNINDREARLAYQILNRAFMDLAVQFGMSPVARRKIEVSPASAGHTGDGVTEADVMLGLIQRLGGAA